MPDWSWILIVLGVVAACVAVAVVVVRASPVREPADAAPESKPVSDDEVAAGAVTQPEDDDEATRA